MKQFILVLALVLSSSVFAVDKGEMKEMLQKMQESGMFTEEQIKAAQKQLEGMSDSDLKALEEKAKVKASDPEVQKKLKELQAN